MNSKILNLKEFLNNNCNYYTYKICDRQRKLDFSNLLFFICNLIINNSSYTVANSNLKINNIIDVSAQAIRKKRNNIDNNIFEQLTMKLYKHINDSGLLKNDNIFAIDGTKITLDKSFTKYGYYLTPNKSYCKANVSCIYDITNKIPLGYHLDSDYNERASFIKNLLSNIPIDSILLFDRGYYSENLMKEIININKNLKFIIRVPFTVKIIKTMKKDNLSTFEHSISIDDKSIPIKYITYNIDNNNYYIVSNILDQPNDYFQKMYHYRWNIEEYFKSCKNDLNLDNILAKEINKCKQELYCHSFIQLLTNYLKIIIDKYKSTNTNKTYKINHKNSINIISNKILFYLLFKYSLKKIINCLIIIEKNRIIIREKRHFERKRRRAVSEFYKRGRKEKNKLKEFFKNYF